VEHLASLIVGDNRSDRYFDFEILAVPAVPIASFAVPATLSTEGVIEAEFQESVFMVVGDEINIAAVTAVSAARTTTGNKLFPAKGNAAMPPITGFYCDFGFVNEHDKKAAIKSILMAAYLVP
jgi:hypothetical protein